MNNKNYKSNERWSSLLGFVWVAAGASVGLGNIWKFPYMVGSSGGSAFVLLYLLFVMILGIPVMAAEIALGRSCRRNAIDGFSYLAKTNGLSKLWSITGYLGLISLQLIFCFYSVVAGWSIFYSYFSLTKGFLDLSHTEVQGIWFNLLASPVSMLLCSFIFISSTMGIIYLGVKKGIERICSILMPVLIILLLLLVLYSALEGDMRKTLSYMFSFNYQDINLKIILSSIGHAFFTLAVGACAMFIYGTYLPKETSIFKSVSIIAFLDVTIALLAGLAIFPLVFMSNMQASQGPGLTFLTLPMAFCQIKWGNFLATLFFVLLFFAALSSSISFAEPLVNALSQKTKLTRTKSCIAIMLSTFMGASICALSFNVLADIKLLGLNLFDFFANISTNILLPIGAMLICIFAGLAIKQQDILLKDNFLTKFIYTLWRWVVIFLSPLLIGLIILTNALWS